MSKVAQHNVWFLRFSRLKHVPPATHLLKVLTQQGYQGKIVEFDYTGPASAVEDREGWRWHWWGLAWVGKLPHVLRATTLYLVVFFKLLQLVRSEGRPSLVLAQGLGEQTLAYFLKRLVGISYVVQVHEVYEAKRVRGLNRFFVWVEGRALNAAEFLIFPERQRAEWYTQLYRLSCPIEIVFNAPPLRAPVTQPRPMKSLTSQDRLVVYLGGVGRPNGIEESIRAFGQLPEYVHFAIVGWCDEGFKQELEHLIKQLNLGARVHLVGTTEDKWPWVDGADVGLCLYRGDEPRTAMASTASNKILEFVSAGVPVVTGVTENYSRFLQNYVVGEYVDSLAPDKIAAGIQRALARDLTQERPRIRAFHQGPLHYEAQVKPVLARLKVSLSR